MEFGEVPTRITNVIDRQGNLGRSEAAKFLLYAPKPQRRRNFSTEFQSKKFRVCPERFIFRKPLR